MKNIISIKLLRIIGIFVVLSISIWTLAFAYATNVRAEDDESNSVKKEDVEKSERTEVNKVENEDSEGAQEDEDENEYEDATSTENKDDDNEATENSREHDKKLSESVKKLMELAKEMSKSDRGIGNEVSKIAKEERDIKGTTTEAIKNIENRSRIISLLIGADLKNLGQLRSSIVTTENHINALNNIKSKVTADVSTTLDVEITALTQEKARLEGIVKDNEDVFSFFGWFVKIIQ